MKVALIVPCYNEEEVLEETARRLLDLLGMLASKGKVEQKSGLYFVDDGSTDSTWTRIEELAKRNNQIHGVKLSRNQGHQNAVVAGLFSADGDVLVTIDADLQDDIDAIEQMLDEFTRGAEIVYGVRRRRDTDTIFKRITAIAFYRLMRLFGTDLIFNHADFRLMSRRAVDQLKEFKEVNLFLRGLVPLLGFTSSTVEYDRGKRLAGETKYPFTKMLGFALAGITSFSVVPLRMITFIGLAVFTLTIILSLWVLGIRLLTDTAVPGWASTVLPIYFIGGVQIFCIGIIGEYLGKIYSEVKSRPRYIIEKVI